MVLPIPTGIDYTVTLRQGGVPRMVLCESCGQQYYYFMEIAAVGQDSSLLFLNRQGAQERAREKAQKNLDQALKDAVCVAPCPSCGRIQSSMWKTAQDESKVGVWLMVAGVILFFVGAMVFYNTMTSGGDARLDPDVETSHRRQLLIAGGLGLAAVSLGAFGWFRNRKYDPNTEPLEDRLKLAQSVSKTESQLAELFKLVESPPPQPPGEPRP